MIILVTKALGKLVGLLNLLGSVVGGHPGSIAACRSLKCRAEALEKLVFSLINTHCRKHHANYLLLGYFQVGISRKVSLTDLGEAHLRRFKGLPALSLVPDWRAPPKGCCPTTAPVHLSLM